MSTESAKTLRSAVKTRADQRTSELISFRDLHQAQAIIVCGCGQSLRTLDSPHPFISIGVNDVGRLFDPTYLVVVNPPSQFASDRFRYVEQSRAKYLFTQLDFGRVAAPVVRIKLGKYGGTDPHRDGLPYTQNSPYVAVCLAAYMGARRIGLIGVDFTDDHFFERTGTHPLARRLAEIDGQYGRLAAALAEEGVELVNLSSESRLSSLPKVSLQAFGEAALISAAAQSSVEGPAKSAPRSHPSSLRIVSYATTPVAGVPAILARCITGATEHQARCVWAANGYGNGVEFAGDMQWRGQSREALELLEAAAVVIVHNGKVDEAHRRLLESKPVVTMAHNYGWNVDMQFVKRGLPGVVVGQYQATLPEFAGWAVVPNPVPLWEPEYMPGSKGEQVCIAFTPSGRHERYPANHRLYWHSKGYETTMRVLERLARQSGIRIEATSRGQVSHAEALAMKQRAHIVIDECVTGSYHRNSLEGLAAGCVVVNGVGLLPSVSDTLRRCAPRMEDIPFVFSDLNSLERTLRKLIERGTPQLCELGGASRDWLVTHWDFEQQWKTFWGPVLERAMERTRATHYAQPIARVATPRPELVRRGARRKGVSVVIPHASAERLPHLEASLKNLAQTPGVAEVIVAEMGDPPCALELASTHGARYVLVHEDGPFERGRALNVGSGVALYERILWKDNDLLVPPDFIVTAAAEMSSRELDNLLPYASIGYLGRDDSRAVMEGRRSADSCKAAKVLTGGREACGGAALVRADFLDRYGGIPEGFLGWGGEDNAWMHKATLLGRTGVTARQSQKLFHLYHADSGAQSGAPWDANPHYRDNVALLTRLRATRNAQSFMSQFPNTGRATCPWKTLPLALVHDRERAELARAVSAELRELFGTEVTVLDEADARGAESSVVLTLGREGVRIETPGTTVSAALTVDLTSAHGEHELGALLTPALSVAARAKAGAALPPPVRLIARNSTTDKMPVDSLPSVRNVFACLVHESVECVVDLVRNLQCHDPTSVVLLYNGGNDPGLLTKRFPFEKYGAVICPDARPMRWGYLHDFALDCMRFVLRHMQFDTLTIVDSDQLATRPGYSAHIGAFLAGKRNVGMLSSTCERQPRSTRIAPAAQAWREFELWRPLLRRFPRGEEQFVRWTFWPATVFTREGALALVAMFKDAELQSILGKSRIWATEEIILPTLLAAQGLGVELNPCSGDYVKYRQAFSLRQLALALRRQDVFWVHPAARRYDDPLRKHIRRAANDYRRGRPEGAAMNAPSQCVTTPPLLLTMPVLQKMRRIEGWLDDEEADVLIAATARALQDLAESNAIVEIGSFCGRSTVVLASAIKAFAKTTRLYAIDPHTGDVGALDEGVRNCGPTLDKLRSNLQATDVADVVEIVSKASYDVEWDRPISLLFIDGLHDYASVACDFHHFEQWIVSGGYVAFHDYATYYPGVMTFVDELLSSSTYRLVVIQKSLALIQRVRA